MLPQAHEPHESHESRESEAPGPRRARHAARSPEVARWPNLGRASRAAIGIVTIALTAAVVVLAPNLAAADPPAPSTGASPAPDASSASPAPTTSADPTATPTPTPSADPTATPTPTAAPTQPAPPTARIPLRKGMVGAKVTTAQQRLTWLGYSISKSSQERQLFGDTTVAAVRAFQAKNWLPVTGRIDKRTWRMLTRQAEPVGILPLRCTQARKALCIDKTTRLLRYVVNGKVKMVADARFGAPGMETDEGVFTVHEKSYNHVSSKYHTWMPRAMFFNRDEAVHYSPDFASVGYSRGSHGCVGLRDMTKATWLFDQVPVGTRVYVYWS